MAPNVEELEGLVGRPETTSALSFWCSERHRRDKPRLLGILRGGAVLWVLLVDCVLTDGDRRSSGAEIVTRAWRGWLNHVGVVWADEVW